MLGNAYTWRACTHTHHDKIQWINLIEQPTEQMNARARKGKKRSEKWKAMTTECVKHTYGYFVSWDFRWIFALLSSTWLSSIVSIFVNFHLFLMLSACERVRTCVQLLAFIDKCMQVFAIRDTPKNKSQSEIQLPADVSGCWLWLWEMWYLNRCALICMVPFAVRWHNTKPKCRFVIVVVQQQSN